MRDVVPAQEIPVHTWEAAKRALRELPAGWVFRGQRDARWQLETSLERAVNRAGGDRNLAEAEQVLLSEFKRRAHHYLNSAFLPPSTMNELPARLEWLALMQHHGGPTRMLDWTRSPYVAAYFAVEDAADDGCAVWAFNAEWSLRQAVSDEPELATESPSAILTSDEYLRRLFDSGIDGVYPVEPQRLNERISIQQGLFLLPGRSAATVFESFLAYANDQVAEHLCKIVIPQSARIDALVDLQTMNINRASLFPGLDGFSQSLAYLLANPRYFDTYWRTPDELAEKAGRLGASGAISREWPLLTESAVQADLIKRLNSLGFTVEVVPASTAGHDLLVRRPGTRPGSRAEARVDVKAVVIDPSAHIMRVPAARTEPRRLWDVRILAVLEPATRVEFFTISRSDWHRLARSQASEGANAIEIQNWRSELGSYRGFDALQSHVDHYPDAASTPRASLQMEV